MSKTLLEKKDKWNNFLPTTLILVVQSVVIFPFQRTRLDDNLIKFGCFNEYQETMKNWRTIMVWSRTLNVFLWCQLYMISYFVKSALFSFYISKSSYVSLKKHVRQWRLPFFILFENNSLLENHVNELVIPWDH